MAIAAVRMTARRRLAGVRWTGGTHSVHGTACSWGATPSYAESVDALRRHPEASQRAEKYAATPRDELLRRVVALEFALEGAEANVRRRLDERAAAVEKQVYGRSVKPAAPLRSYDVLGQPCRKIALRLCYDGEPYLGLAAQVGLDSLLPTPWGHPAPHELTRADLGPGTNSVEAVLWHALCRLRLVEPRYGMMGAEFSRCGRTDRGVSAASQVVSLWVRSKKTDEWDARKAQRRAFRSDDEAASDPILNRKPALDKDGSPAFELAKDELPYVVALNQVLPPTIRVTGWSPVRADFSARFDCRYRHYKYFFSEGAPAALGPVDGHHVPSGKFHAGRRLDIVAMRDAAARFLGEHDFRNFCRLDPSKQITNFRRRIDGISIDPVEPGWPTRPPPQDDPALDPAALAYPTDDTPPCRGGEQMYVLNLRGLAFLHNQVRHMMAVLFMVGAGVEHPSVVDELLNVAAGAAAADRLAMRLAGWRVGPDALAGHAEAVAIPGSTATSMAGAVAADSPRGYEDVQRRIQEAQTAMAGIRAAVRAGRPDGVHEPAARDLGHMYDALPVVDSKPVYELAKGEPLMLWECGFRASDVQWRTGTHDEPLFGPEGATGVEADWPTAVRATRTVQSQQTGTDVSAQVLSRYVHAEWYRAAIKAEMYRHLVLASPTPASGGWGSASSLYNQARQPKLIPSPPPEYLKASRTFVPLGHGCSRPGQPKWKKLATVAREDPPEVRNARFRQDKGWKVERSRAKSKERYTLPPIDSKAADE